MKKLTTKMKRSPETPEETKMLHSVMVEINKCFMAYSLNRDILVAINGIEVLTNCTREEFANKVSDCNQVIALITFIPKGVLTEMSFLRGRDVLEILSFMYDGYDERCRVP